RASRSQLETRQWAAICAAASGSASSPKKKTHTADLHLHHCTQGSATKHSSCIHSTRSDPVVVLTIMYSSMTPVDLPQPVHTGAFLCWFNSPAAWPSSVGFAR